MVVIGFDGLHIRSEHTWLPMQLKEYEPSYGPPEEAFSFFWPQMGKEQHVYAFGRNAAAIVSGFHELYVHNEHTRGKLQAVTVYRSRYPKWKASTRINSKVSYIHTRCSSLCSSWSMNFVTPEGRKVFLDLNCCSKSSNRKRNKDSDAMLSAMGHGWILKKTKK